MDDVVSAASRSLKHVAVREYVRALVQDADVGDPTPSERELVERFGVARMTVRQAMDALVAEGLLERSPGRGTFVSRPRRQVGRLSSFTDDMEQRGLAPGAQTLRFALEQAGPGVARALGLSAGDAVLRWKRVRTADGVPIAVEDAFLNEVLLPGFLHAGPPASLFSALAARGMRPTAAEDAISADQPSTEETTLLRLPRGLPVLRVSRRTLAGDRPIEVSRMAFRADRFTVSVQLG